MRGTVLLLVLGLNLSHTQPVFCQSVAPLLVSKVHDQFIVRSDCVSDFPNFSIYQLRHCNYKAHSHIIIITKFLMQDCWSSIIDKAMDESQIMSSDVPPPFLLTRGNNYPCWPILNEIATAKAPDLRPEKCNFCHLAVFGIDIYINFQTCNLSNFIRFRGGVNQEENIFHILVWGNFHIFFFSRVTSSHLYLYRVRSGGVS